MDHNLINAIFDSIQFDAIGLLGQVEAARKQLTDAELELLRDHLIELNEEIPNPFLELAFKGLKKEYI
jgi:hypothetical protein